MKPSPTSSSSPSRVSEAARPACDTRHPVRHAHERQVLDLHAPGGAKNLPMFFWIHDGGWRTGDKTMVALKPKAFTDAPPV